MGGVYKYIGMFRIGFGSLAIEKERISGVTLETTSKAHIMKNVHRPQASLKVWEF